MAGNPGKRPLNDREPVVPVPTSAPYAPRHLGHEAKREWRRMATILLEAGLYSEVDRAALAMYCQAWGRWVEAERELAKGDTILEGPNGGMYQSAWLSVANKAQDQLRKMIAEFGLSPAQRSRVVAMGTEKEPTLAEILFNAAGGE
jgi:P27 family predicted phage terminase small subunit